MVYRLALLSFASGALAFAALPASAAPTPILQSGASTPMLQLVDAEMEVDADKKGDVEVRAPNTDVDVKDDDVQVQAPYTDVDVKGDNVHVEAPYTSVDVSDGVRVKAPFVDIYVPRR
jgi:hypothetical protein